MEARASQNSPRMLCILYTYIFKVCSLICQIVLGCYMYSYWSDCFSFFEKNVLLLLVVIYIYEDQVDDLLSTHS